MSDATEGPVPILVVDDRPENLAALTAILRNPGYLVVPANSGPAALVALLRYDFAVVLLDVLMPGMDGFETARLMRQRERSQAVPILFLTATSDDPRLVHDGYSVGAVDYLVKPIDPDIVRAKVGVFAELYRRGLALKAQGEALRAAERDIARRQLEAQELEYAAIFDLAPVGIARVGPDGHCRRVNRRFGEILDITPAGLIGRSWRSLPLPPLPGLGERVEAWVNRLDGTPVSVELSQATLRDADGSFEGMVVVIEDTTERKRTEERLRRLADENEVLYQGAKAAVQVRDDFLSIASHELRTPLTPLLIHLQRLERQALERGPLTPERVAPLVQSAVRQVRRLTALVDNLLDVTRISANRLNLNLTEFDLCELVSEVTTRFAEQLARAGCSLEVTRSGEVFGRWDALRIDQVISNLLSNAVKYAAGSKVVVEVGVERSRATIRVSDQGMGIPPDRLEQIFGRFERAVPARSYGGLGLGLYIAQKISQAHGGSIEVESEIGRGTSFTVRLPVQTVSRSSEAISALPLDPRGGQEETNDGR